MRPASDLLVAFTLGLSLAAGCSRPPPSPPSPSPAAWQSPAARCDEAQQARAREGDERASPHGVDQHVARHFADGRVAWLMKEEAYQRFVVAAHAERFGRCEKGGCYQFTAPASVIEEAVRSSQKGATHDAALLGEKLGLPASNLEGPLRLIVLDAASAGVCARLPVAADPGAYPCKSADDRACFKPGGYTTGGVPELLLVDAPVDKAQVSVVP